MIVFSAASQKLNCQIYLSDDNGKNLYCVTGKSGLEWRQGAILSPDRRQLFFSVSLRQLISRYYVVDVYRPGGKWCWAIDSKSIIYDTFLNGSLQINRVDMEGNIYDLLDVGELGFDEIYELVAARLCRPTKYKEKIMKYKSVVVTRRGPPEVLTIIENDLRAPLAGEICIKILAACVCLPDVQARYGHTPFAPKIPFVPGYAIVGVVDAIGERVTSAAVGDRVAALTTFGGYAEFIYLDKERLIPVPNNLDPAEAVTLILNYVLAFQILHRSVKVKAGDKVLIIGASGGVGTAFLQLGRLANLTMYGLASPSKHNVLIEMGAIPIDYHTQDFVEVVRQAELNGLDAVFDGMGGDYLERGFSLLRRGGTLVEYGNPLSFSGMLLLLAKVVLFNLMPNGKTVKLYGNSSRINLRPFLEDWAVLFKLLEEGKIKPVITGKFPILEAAQANALLESGKVIGNVVLLAPELL